MASLALVAGVVVAYGAVSARLDRTPVTGPMVFVAVGLVLGVGGLDVLELGFDEAAIRILAEATLVLVLFVDATGIRLRRLRREAQLPGRMLAIALPLTVVAGALVAAPLLGLAVWEAALLAAVLAPTDAALGQAVVTDERVPDRIRDTLTVESGLNDGLALPLVTVFIGLAAGEEGVAGYGPVQLILEQVGYGAVLGLAVGAAGGWLIRTAVEAGWMDGLFRQLSTFALAVAAFALAETVGGNGFIAAFVAGLAFGHVAREECPHVADFAEDQGHLLALITFLLFGAIMAGEALGELTLPIAIYAVLSLTVIRMAPVALSLVGTGLRPVTVGFLGWFGPRGLASILFAVLVVEEADLAVEDHLLTVVAWTVLGSVFLHGLTATPAADRFGRYTGAMDKSRPEHAPPPRAD